VSAVRLVLTVALAVAVVAAVLPTVDRARVESADRAVRGEMDALGARSAALLAAEEPTPVGPPPRRLVRVSLPAAGWGSSGVDYLAVGGPPGGPVLARDGTTVFTYRLSERPERRVRLPTPLRPAGSPVVVRGEGRLLVLELVRSGDRTVVRVRPFDPGPRHARVEV
jgi:hypothetical protein